jgi:hypothetical protein
MVKYFRNISLLIGSFLMLQITFAQRNWNGYGIEINGIHAQVFKHTAAFKAPLPSASQLIELHAFHKTRGEKPWHALRHFPQIGIGFTYTNYGLDSVYGRGYSIYPTIQYQLTQKKAWSWTYRMGLGAGYLSKKFERYNTWDTLNNMIGSGLNIYFMAATDLRYTINSHWDIQAGLQFAHFSNAATLKPNLGINSYGFHLGVRFFPFAEDKRVVIGKDAVPQLLDNKKVWNLRLAYAINQSGSGDGPLYGVYHASFMRSKYYRHKNKVFGGIDITYHKRIYAFLRNNEIYPGAEKVHSYNSSIFVGNTFLFGKIGFQLQTGVYIKNAYLHDEPWYQKFGFEYYIMQHPKGFLKELAVSGLVKTHINKAELLEWGLNCGF